MQGLAVGALMGMRMARKGEGESATTMAGSGSVILLYWEVPSNLPHLPHLPLVPVIVTLNCNLTGTLSFTVRV